MLSENFAPDFVHFNDDIFFGENRNNTDIDLKTRSIITVVALMAQGVTDNSIRYIQSYKKQPVIPIIYWYSRLFFVKICAGDMVLYSYRYRISFLHFALDIFNPADKHQHPAKTFKSRIKSRKRQRQQVECSAYPCRDKRCRQYPQL